MSTSAESKKSSRREKSLRRPFNRALLKKARAVADRYKIIIEREEDDWHGRGLELPTAFGDGPTVDAAVADTREALVTAVAYLLEEGRKPPAPAREGSRSAQVNVRLTPEEKVILESRAKERGFRGLSDFIRSSVLTEK